MPPICLKCDENASCIRNLAVHQEVSSHKVSAHNFFGSFIFMSKYSDHMECAGHPIVINTFIKRCPCLWQNTLELKIMDHYSEFRNCCFKYGTIKSSYCISLNFLITLSGRVTYKLKSDMAGGKASLSFYFFYNGKKK